MTPPIDAFVGLADGIDSSAVEPFLSEAGGVRVLGYSDTPVAFRTGVQQPNADLVLVACSGTSAAALTLVADAVGERRDAPVIVLQLGDADSNGFMQQVFAAGADDLISLPDSPERIRHALQKAVARRRSTTASHGATLADVICVLGPKGGTGKTVTSCNLSVALAQAGRRVILVDLDLRFGDVGLGLRLAPERTIYDLARSGGALDAGKLEDYLVTHESGVRALLAPTRPEQAGLVTAEFIGQVLAVARAASDVVVVDTPAGFPPETITVIDGSTDVCAVAMLDAFSLKDTKLGLETLDLMGYDRDAIRVLINRADSHVGIGQNDVRTILGRQPDVLVPSDRDIPRSVTEGVPIVTSKPGSAAAKEFRRLAELFTTGHDSAPTPVPTVAEPTPRGRFHLRRA